MASSAKDIPLRELKDTISGLKTMVSEKTELIKSLRLVIDEKSSHEKALQEQVDYLTKKLFGSSSEKSSHPSSGRRSGLSGLWYTDGFDWRRICPPGTAEVQLCNGR